MKTLHVSNTESQFYAMDNEKTDAIWAEFEK